MLGLADRADHADQAARAEFRRGEQPRNLVLQAQDQLGALLRGDVAADAAVAGEFSARPEDRLAAHLHIARRAVGKLARHEHVVEGLPCLEDDTMRFPAAFDFEAATLPASRADEARAQLLIAAGDVTAFEPRETEIGILLPIPVGGERRQAAKARFAFAHGLLRRGALEVLADHRCDDVQRLVQALVRGAHAPARDVEHSGHATGCPDRKHRCGDQTRHIGGVEGRCASVRDPARSSVADRGGGF